MSRTFIKQAPSNAVGEACFVQCTAHSLVETQDEKMCNR